MHQGRVGRGAAAVATIAAVTLITPAADALTVTVAGVSAPADLPAAPQVSNPLPPLSSAVPVAAPQPSAPAPAAPAAIAAPTAGARFAPLQVSAVAAAPSAPSAPSATSTPAVGQAPASSGPSAAEVRKRHAEQQTRRLRQAVLRMQGCLGSLPQRQQDYLTLRAGIGRERAMARAAAAKRVGIAQDRARAFERRSLRALKQVCSGNGGSGVTTGSARTSFVVARTGATGATGGSTAAQVEPVAQSTPQGEHQVLAEQKSHGPQQEGQGEGQGATPSALPRTTGAIPKPPAGNSPSELWVVAALAALAALAGASLIRRRGRFRFEMTPLAAAVAPAVAGAGAVAEGAAAPADPTQEVVRDALGSLSAGDVAGAAALVHPDVRWPDPGNGTIEGRERFEAYWNSRLSTVTVEIEPVSYERRNGELLVEVNEIVRSRMTRTMIGEYHAMRRFTFRDGLIAEMKHGRG